MNLLDHYKVITVTHHNLNVGEIGNFYIQANDKHDKSSVLRKIKFDFEFEECIYLETCNRVCYVLFGDFELDKAYLSRFFKSINSGLSESTLSSIHKFVSTYEGESAIKHIYELASSMDSLVVGEREIFRQLRGAFEASKEWGLTGDYLRLLEKTVVTTAKDIYNTTKIGEKSLSVVSLAINAMMDINNSPDQNVLLIGSGETNSLVGKFLKKYNFKNVTIYNRSLDNASQLSQTLNAPAFHLNELKNVAGNFDIIVICTSANKVVITEQLYSQMLKGQTDSKLLIDLAVPRNIAPEIVENFNVKYIDINSLKERSEENLKFRKTEVDKARPIIRNHVKNFKNIFQQRHIEKAMANIPSQVKEVKEKAISVIYKKRLEELDPKAQALMEEMMNYMEKKCVSIPIKAAKRELKS